MIRGNLPAKIDDKGRLKIPSAFRIWMDGHGADLFVTSVSGEFVQVYPMSVWEAIEAKLAQVPSAHPSRIKYFDRVNYFGQPAEFDKQGRVSIHARLRESAAMAGEVDVFGQYDHLAVWNHDRFVAKLQREPYSDDDARALAEFGI
ncbi:MAG: division/cell wall cluster transcriptional repressor MraZ [Acidobacteriota bacterium]|nr:division/cell wall cluster transcriptional repressor MraZ [Acidobacteriota bacterium]